MAVEEVFSGDGLELLGDGEMDGRLSALLGCLEEGLDNEQQTPGQRCRYVAPDPAVDHARVEAVGRDTSALQSARQLESKDDVCVLGHVVQVGGERRRRVDVVQVENG